MKKFFITIVAVIVSVFIGKYLYEKYSIRKNTVPYTLENKTYHLLIAKSPLEWEKGLMFVKKKDGFDGMIFEFPDYQQRTFWNMNTLVDLDVYWVKDTEVVGKSEVLSIEKTKDYVTVSSPTRVNKVIEIIK